jgi:hypothetical protein
VPKSATYTISVTRLETTLGELSGVKAGGSSFPVQLNAAPAAGDVVTVKSFDKEGIENASGTCTLADSGSVISVPLSPLPPGTGNIDLEVSFDSGTGTDKINYAHHYLYTSSNYKTSGSYKHEKDHPFPEEGTKKIISISHTSLTPGDYVLKIEFQRSAGIVSRLLQAVNVRSGFTTNTWVESGSKTLIWNVFASSNVNLNSVYIDGKVTSYISEDSEYNLYTPTTSIPDSMTLKVTAGEPGQVITAMLNNSGTAVPLTSDGHTFTTGLGLKNSFEVTVTAPDGIANWVYHVNINGNEITKFFFDFEGKKYGVGPGVKDGSGTIDQRTHTITVNVPYRYGTELITKTPDIDHLGSSHTAEDSLDQSNPVWGTKPNPHTYTIRAADGTPQQYKVTVNVAEPITISGYLSAEEDITFYKGQPSNPINEVSSTTDDTLIISIANVTDWYIDIMSGNDTINTYSNTNTFNAPPDPGSYNVTVRVSPTFSEDGGSATGSFTLLVE